MFVELWLGFQALGFRSLGISVGIAQKARNARFLHMKPSPSSASF